jgi:Ras-related protein Rab-11A
MSRDLVSDQKYKIVIIGDSGIGKSNLLLRYTKNEFLPEFRATVGAEFATKLVIIQGINIRVQLWDTSGSEKYKSVANTYYRGAQGALLVFDIVNRSSFESLPKWLSDLRNEIGAEAAILLVGNKADMKEYRDVQYDEAEEFAKKNKLCYIETSALEPLNVDLAFNTVVHEIYALALKDEHIKKSVMSERLRDSIILTPALAKATTQKKQSNCC